MLSTLTNIPALRALAASEQSRQAMNTSMERLATGLRINRAADDPAGLQVSERLKGDEADLKAKIDGIDREGSMLGARDGAHSVVRDMVSDLHGLVVQAANTGGLGEGEGSALQGQAGAILQSIDFLGNTTTFQGEQIMSGTRAANLGHVTRSEQQADGTMADKTYSLADVPRLMATQGGDAELAGQIVDAATSQLADEAGAMGAREQQLDSEKRVMLTQLENTSAARSQITDTDFAAETSSLVRPKVIEQAGRAMTFFAQQQNVFVDGITPERAAA